ncbi:CubicO group peptidase (beta-lactamase class C family) [Brevibacterium sanguinis]|uniref:CubicO group peptidase (Beta-lactamase class C family) n=2 Tax=Brevibacterium TaxID=1696 RepID=A0A366IPX5_9MICO|nr:MULTISPECIES: serine hydrolase domain-containing protein [Brevibacterium]RBP67148.1 CubicO group peptidase (beta-lactamase class C family) [Brevibacterium sanguinis]RBP73673.1 CubicO group peptidase (beta-lactamase class C family) [Brevibacterium celere]
MEFRHESAIDSLFADVAVDEPGAAVGIYHRGELMFAKGYGLADLEGFRPITARTPFHVASVSKQFTAFSIALLAGEGRVDLNADVREYLPYVPAFGETITVRHLILHTSGLRNHITLSLLSGHGDEVRMTQQQVLNLVVRQNSLNFRPGTDYAYSNTGYVLLAEIVFAATGRTLREFCAEQIFAPLGMKSTFFVDDITEVGPFRASSYTRRRDEYGHDTGEWARALLNFDNVGSSGLLTTVEDLALWSRNLVNPVVGDKDCIEQLCGGGTLDDGTPINYGFGLERGAIAGREAFSHTGSDAAFRSVFTHFPDHEFTVAILANTELGLLSKVSAIADLYLPEAEPEVQEPPIEDTEADLSGWVGVYAPPHDISRRLELRDGSLFHRLGSREPQRLTARADGTLDFGSPRLQSLVPILDADGRVIGIEIPQPGSGASQVLPRVSVPDHLNVDLAEYVGDFRSPELDITYNIGIEDGGLVTCHLWSNRLSGKLSPVLPDRFEYPGDRLRRQLKMIVEFLRDDSGRIDSLILNAGGERDIRFKRVDSTSPLLPQASIRARGTWL